MIKPAHRISQAGVAAAQIHAEAVEQHGKDIEAIADRVKGLQASPNFENFDAAISESAEWVACLGQAVQAQAQLSLEHARRLQDSDGELLEEYYASVEAHVEATQAHVQATNVLLKLLRKTLNDRKSIHPEWSQSSGDVEP